MKTNNKVNRTIQINGQLIISKLESGQEYVQFLPDNPVVGQVEPFAGLAKAQLLNNGVFDSLRKKRKQRGKPVFKAGWTSLSFAGDGNDYIVLKSPCTMRYMLAKNLMSDARRIAAYLKKEGYSE